MDSFLERAILIILISMSIIGVVQKCNDYNDTGVLIDFIHQGDNE